ncbi:uncharacterized protein V6R79_008411 [Siganus canaliculatus]
MSHFCQQEVLKQKLPGTQSLLLDMHIRELKPNLPFLDADVCTSPSRSITKGVRLYKHHGSFAVHVALFFSERAVECAIKLCVHI